MGVLWVPVRLTLAGQRLVYGMLRTVRAAASNILLVMALGCGAHSEDTGTPAAIDDDEAADEASDVVPTDAANVDETDGVSRTDDAASDVSPLGSSDADDPETDASQSDTDVDEVLMDDGQPDSGAVTRCPRRFCQGNDLYEDLCSFEPATTLVESCRVECVDTGDSAHCVNAADVEGGVPVAQLDGGVSAPDRPAVADGGLTASDAGREDAIAPDLIGHVERSCGAFNFEDGMEIENTIVDCTEFGDEESICVFSNHCWCSAGFHCAGSEPEPSGRPMECPHGATCVPND